MKKQGKVYFVGAGPGDPGLITVKGRDCLSRAEVIIYDRLLDPRMLELFPIEAEAIYAGKKSGQHDMKQEEINKLLLKKAQEGKIVVRLKGGDPFVFGRGGEEVEIIAAAGIPFEIVPGVTAAIAVPAYAGIPVTYRKISSSVAIVTGHEDPAKKASAINWKNLATATDSLVFLMGVENIEKITETLVKDGLSPGTPAAVIANGTSPRQLTIIATLDTIAHEARVRNISPPAVLVVGKVVGMREKLRWFENRPLFGKSILITRTRHQASVLSQLLYREGAQPVEFSVIDIKAIKNNRKLDKALASLNQYYWIIFTSVNAVSIFFHRLQELRGDARWLKGVSVGAVGPATAQELLKFGIGADFIPPQFTNTALAAELPIQHRGIKILLLRAEDVTEDLASELKRRGAAVETVPLYRTVTPVKDVSPLKQTLKERKLDMVTFTSSSTVKGLLSLIGEEIKLLKGVKVACIGPVTAATAREMGLEVNIVAHEHTIPGLVKAIKEYYQRRQA